MPPRASFDYVESNEASNVLKGDQIHATSSVNEVAI